MTAGRIVAPARSRQGQRASTEDFRRVAEQHAGTDLGWFFDQWIYRTEIPSYRVAYRFEPAEGGQYRVKLKVQQENVAEDLQMYVPVTVDLSNGQRRGSNSTTSMAFWQRSGWWTGGNEEEYLWGRPAAGDR